MVHLQYRKKLKKGGRRSICTCSRCKCRAFVKLVQSQKSKCIIHIITLIMFVLE